MTVLFYKVYSKYLADEVPGGWSSISSMGFGCGVVFSPSYSKYRLFSENDKSYMIKLLEASSTIIGYGNYEFDNEILFHDDTKLLDQDQKALDLQLFIIRSVYDFSKALDINKSYTQLCRLYPLYKILKSTLDYKSNVNNYNTPVLLREGKLSLLHSILINEVTSIFNLYKFMLSAKCVTLPDGARINVDIKNYL